MTSVRFNRCTIYQKKGIKYRKRLCFVWQKLICFSILNIVNIGKRVDRPDKAQLISSSAHSTVTQVRGCGLILKGGDDFSHQSRRLFCLIDLLKNRTREEKLRSFDLNSPPCCVLTCRTSDGGPSPTEVKPRTRRLYVTLVVNPEMVVSRLSSVLCFCQALSCASGSVV